MIFLPEAVERAIKKLSGNDFEAYAVGGCVRDSVMGNIPHDWDITTSATPEETKEVFKDFKTIDTGIKHGTVTVLVDSYPLEITTFRIDGEYSDNRRPDNVTFTRNLKEDLSRRDFTINALAFCGEEIVDCFGGIKDIENKIIRTVGDPDRRFNEDALRIVRALRFASVLGFEIEEETEKSIRKNKSLLNNIAPERIKEELSKLICGKNAENILLEFPDVLAEFIPEIARSVNFNQKNRHHIYDVYTHTVKSVAGIDPDPVLRLTMLFHDIGKPYCFTVDGKGEGHFKGHAHISFETAEKRLAALRYDNNTINQVLTLIKYHDALIEDDDRLIKRWLNRLSPEGFFNLLKVKKADNLAQNPEYDRGGYITRLEEKATEILDRKECFSLSDLKINGDDLIGLGIPQGKKIGKTLDFLLKAVTDGKCENEKQKLINFLQNH